MGFFNLFDEKKEQNANQGAANTQGDVHSKIREMIHSSDVFLFMKGTPDSPMCGFSSNIVRILGDLGVQYKSFNVLSDGQVRQAVKEFSNWPTYPQLYFKGELIGGNDIAEEMFRSGELKKLLTPAN